MSAADRREELEAAIWQRVHDSAARPTGLTRQGMTEILAAADKYADAARGEAITRMTSTAAARLVQAAAEVERARAS